jgi:hypothetical protein
MAQKRHGPGELGVVAQLAFAIGIGIVATFASHPTPEPIPRGLAVGLLYATPAVIAALGIVGGRVSLLLAAAVLDVLGAPLSWSLVTLLFLVPAILFVGHAGRASAVAAATASSRVVGALASAAIVALVALSAAAVAANKGWVQSISVSHDRITWTPEGAWNSRTTSWPS